MLEISPHSYELALRQDADAVAYGVEALQIVRDHEDGELERLLQGSDQLVEIARGNRIEAGRRLVEEYELGIEREGPRERHAFGHASRELGRNLCQSAGPRPTMSSLALAISSSSRSKAEMLAHGKLHVLQHRQRGQQRALLEQYPPSLLDHLARILARMGEIGTEHLDRTCTAGISPMIERSRTDLPLPSRPPGRRSRRARR